MTDANSRPVVSVYVLSHAGSSQARYLADRVYRWLRLQDDDGDGTVIGLPVFFRVEIGSSQSVSLPPLERLRRVTQPERPMQAEHVFIVPLVDDHMVVDPSWRKALLRLAEASDGYEPSRDEPAVSVLPVMVDRSFAALTGLSKVQNPIRIYDPQDEPPGEPPTAPDACESGGCADGLAEERRTQTYESLTKAHEARLERWLDQRARRLRRGLTEQIIRDLDLAGRPRSTRGKARRPERLTVFLSHAKADGAKIAQRVRDRLATVSKLVPWFDQNDLVAGRAADEPMEGAARSSSGGMIAIVTDVYPTRPWCWRESMAARTPRRLRRKRFFTTLPTVAVHVAGGRWSRVPSTLDCVARIGWPADLPELRRAGPDVPVGMEIASYRAREAREQQIDERVGDIVERLLLELLMHRVYRRVGLGLAKGRRDHWFHRLRALSAESGAPDP